MSAVNAAGLVVILAGITGWTTLVHLLLTQLCVSFVMGNTTALALAAVLAGRR